MGGPKFPYVQGAWFPPPCVMSGKDKPTVLLEYYLKKSRLPTVLREDGAVASDLYADHAAGREVFRD